MDAGVSGLRTQCGGGDGDDGGLGDRGGGDDGCRGQGVRLRRPPGVAVHAGMGSVSFCPGSVRLQKWKEANCNLTGSWISVSRASSIAGCRGSFGVACGGGRRYGGLRRECGHLAGSRAKDVRAVGEAGGRRGGGEICGRKLGKRQD